ncbi:MAG: K+-sensing histidine kinase KdpD, partial [Glaciecola sp.]
DHIQISAKEIDGELHISVVDDGSGYPASMLEMATVKLNNFCISEGRTGLGLFFARLIAQTHKNNGKSGFIKLSNDEKTGGSVFELNLP